MADEVDEGDAVAVDDDVMEGDADCVGEDVRDGEALAVDEDVGLGDGVCVDDGVDEGEDVLERRLGFGTSAARIGTEHEVVFDAHLGPELAAFGDVRDAQLDDAR